MLFAPASGAWTAGCRDWISTGDTVLSPRHGRCWRSPNSWPPIIACLDGGGRVDPVEAFDRLDDDARRTLAAVARQVLAAAREADV